MKKYYAKTSALCCVLSPLVWAETPATNAQSPINDTLVVTANKREEAVNKIDGSILVKTGQQLEQAGVTQVQELERVFPGLQIRSRGNRTYPAATIRGINSPDYYSPSVQIYVDGVPQDHQFLTQELINVERVELLRGPQGTLYGGNAQAGVLNIITRSPTEGSSLYLSGDYSKLKQGGTFSGSLPLIEDMLYASTSLRWVKEPGQIDNPSRGKKNIDSSRTWLGRGQLTFAPTDAPFSADVSFAHEDLNSHEEVYLSDSQFKQQTYDGELPLLKREVNSYALKADYDFGNTTLSSITSYQDRDIFRSYIGGKWKEQRDGTTQEFRLNTGYQNGANSLIGTYFSNEKAEHHISGYPGYYSDATNKVERESWALFGEVKLPLVEQVDLTLGGRWSHEKAEINYSGRTGLSYIDGFDNNTSSNEFIPKVALGWQYSPETRLYVSATRGYKPGGFNSIVITHDDYKPYETETSDNYELGWHTSFFDNAMTLSGALYYINSKDKQVYVGAIPEQSIRNMGKAESKGLELTTQITPVQSLVFSLGGSFGTSKFTDSIDPNTGTDYNGKRLPYAPDIMVNGGVDYLVDQSSLPGNLYLSTNARYYSRSYFDELNTLKQGSYTLYDAAASLEMPNGVTVRLYGENLSNEKYRTSSFYLGPNAISMVSKGLNVGVNLSVSL